jgi:hypothetical protein
MLKQTSSHWWGRVRGYVAVCAYVLIFAALAVSWSLMVDGSLSSQPGTWKDTAAATNSGRSENESWAAYSGWGSEALNIIHQQSKQWSLIPLANACGKGASSCFKCHDGRRAQAPTTGKDIGAWHLHHQKVNNSCAGCHNGNARIIKQEIAHIGLIADPRKNSEVCASCHKPGDVPTVLKPYQLVKN